MSDVTQMRARKIHKLLRREYPSCSARTRISDLKFLLTDVLHYVAHNAPEGKLPGDLLADVRIEAWKLFDAERPEPDPVCSKCGEVLKDPENVVGERCVACSDDWEAKP